jgi:DNA-binding CsgD family transcriptional regulator
MTGVDLLAEAVETLEQSPARLEWVRAQVRLGAALRRHRSRADALTVLRAGFEHAIELGATRLERHALAELTAAGASAARRPRRADPLTAAEHRVATMAAAGASNRETAEGLFVSLRTIATHLTHTYAKLGIQRRPPRSSAGDARPRNGLGPARWPAPPPPETFAKI